MRDPLGGIPKSRIAEVPLPGTATENDCITFGDRYELIDGTLVEKAIPHEEAFITACLARAITGFVIGNDLGVCSGAKGPLTLWQGCIRMPDIAYFPWKNVEGVKRAAAPMMIPELVVEVLSPSNTAREIERKRRDFFQFGTKLFWKVDPIKRIIEVHTPTGKPRILGQGDKLTGGKVLPGFELAMKELFGYLDGILEKMDG